MGWFLEINMVNIRAKTVLKLESGLTAALTSNRAEE